MSDLRDYLPAIDAAIQAWAPAYGVAITRSLVGGIMLQENPALDPAAVTAEPNGRQSFGLMQVEDSTAATLGYPDPSALLDPAVGIDAGVHYLAHQLARYQGDQDAAIAAYNAGSVRYTTSETFVNSDYVDRVKAFVAGLVSQGFDGAVRAAAAAGPALPIGAIAVALVLLVIVSGWPGPARRGRRS